MHTDILMQKGFEASNQGGMELLVHRLAHLFQLPAVFILQLLDGAEQRVPHLGDPFLVQGKLFIQKRADMAQALFLSEPHGIQPRADPVQAADQQDGLGLDRSFREKVPEDVCRQLEKEMSGIAEGS